MTLERKKFKEMCCEKIIVKSLEEGNNGKHGHEILNDILNFNVNDILTPFRECLKVAYDIEFQNFPNAVIGIIYKDLEHSASNLRANKQGKFFKNMQKLKDPNETAQGIWELY
tara:strand:+ start:1361 stop:1699 length:339 start_codon:yes stop_codon:yes gene_type:complete